MKEIAIESFEWFLIVGSIVALVIGIALFIRPEIVQQYNKKLNKWYSARKKMKPLEIMRETDNIFYHNNKSLGWIMLFGSILCLYIFAFHFPIQFLTKAQVYTTKLELFQDVTLRAIRMFFIIFAIIGIPVWILLIFAPERLKTISNFLNHWISTRLMLLPLEQMHYDFDNFVFGHPRIFGGVFVLGSILTISSLLMNI